MATQITWHSQRDHYKIGVINWDENNPEGWREVAILETNENLDHWRCNVLGMLLTCSKMPDGSPMQQTFDDAQKIVNDVFNALSK